MKVPYIYVDHKDLERLLRFAPAGTKMSAEQRRSFQRLYAAAERGRQQK